MSQSSSPFLLLSTLAGGEEGLIALVRETCGGVEEVERLSQEVNSTNDRVAVFTQRAPQPSLAVRASIVRREKH